MRAYAAGVPARGMMCLHKQLVCQPEGGEGMCYCTQNFYAVSSLASEFPYSVGLGFDVLPENHLRRASNLASEWSIYVGAFNLFLRCFFVCLFVCSMFFCVFCVFLQDM